MLTRWLNSVVRLYSTHVKMSSLVNASIQVLGTGANELAPSFYLFTDSKRYMFNCGENFQRFRAEFRPPLTNMSFFATRVSWRNLGGFIGFSMSARDIGVSSVTLHGPELVEEFAQCARSFVGRKKMKLLTPWSKEGAIPEHYKDENVNIRTVPLFSSSDENITASPASKRHKIICNTAAFVCKLCDVRGKFDVTKAKALGIPPGPIYKKLTAGESVMAPDGRIVEAQEVLGATRIGPTIIVIECPNESYINSVVNSPALSSEELLASNQNVALIVHMSPPNVINHELYQRWAESFGAATKHLILNEGMCLSEFALRRYLKVHVPLHLMNPSVYHPLVESPSPHTPALIQPADSVIYGRSLLKYQLKPALKLMDSALKPLAEEYQTYLQDVKADKQLLDAISSSQHNTAVPLKDSLTLPTKQLTPTVVDSNNPVVTFLGTGSSAPTSYRNISGTLLQTADNGNVLFDCGEGSLSQIYRCFGIEQGNKIVKNINTIFISHIHGDHHLGLLTMLHQRQQLRGVACENHPLLVAPDQLLYWLKRYSQTLEGVCYRSEDCANLVLKSAKNFGLEFKTVPVLHCESAFGVVIRQSSDWSIVYSGDTRPCQALVEAGQGTDLLIHEATFEDILIDDAKAKMHCTIGEALKVASEMDSKFTIMTHFSCRYPKIPTALVDERVGPKVGVALDCMSIGLKDLHSLCIDLPVMKKIFSHVTEEEGEEEIVQYQSWDN